MSIKFIMHFIPKYTLRVNRDFTSSVIVIVFFVLEKGYTADTLQKEWVFFIEEVSFFVY